ncbi:hypothetical protein [Paenibacillus donghaensis]|uniref:Uncharacterized protein n=1 Tax=Paenibacillus donghaensis TaxID=414771 RepID=A0A2Z2K860_9BACL|nr:hypothetical protein [Paenibacillus donghaensis]ASA19405.1 hypothetical protein B9T62_00160 [Paenibacillus donghaensis]
MNNAVIIALYGAALYWGCRKLQGKDSKLHRVEYSCILGWCLYLHLCGINGLRHYSISSLYIAYFQPAGRAIIQWLGG